MISNRKIRVPTSHGKLFQSDRGASMVEYSLLVILIAIVAIVAVAFAGEELSTTYSEISQSVAKAGS